MKLSVITAKTCQEQQGEGGRRGAQKPQNIIGLLETGDAGEFTSIMTWIGKGGALEGKKN